LYIDARFHIDFGLENNNNQYALIQKNLNISAVKNLKTTMKFIKAPELGKASWGRPVKDIRTCY